MLDLTFIRENAEAVQQSCRNRGVDFDVSNLLKFDEQRRSLIASGDQLRREQKEVSGQIPKATPDSRPALVARGKELRELVAQSEQQLAEIEAGLRTELLRVPNMSHPDAPIGPDESHSKTVHEWGEKPKFDFAPKDHVEIMAALDLLDLEGGAKVAGHGFYYLKNEAVMLELGLIQYVVTKLRQEGFTIFTTPDLARDEVLQGIGFIPRGPETQIYSVLDTDLSLVATAEITLGGLLKDEILEVGKLPLKYAGISHCFRTEAGGHGKATRGIYRVHQFTKVEMFGYTGPDVAASDELHKTIVRIEEEIFQGLKIPYRLIDTATGDLGGPAYRKFDLEAWMPGRNEYGEITSASNCTDFQARRLNIRCKSPDAKGTKFVHTLNGTAVACTRAIIAILENNQQRDGSVVIPEVLRPWVGVDVIRPRASS
jgi:seryl-tRNA synthetase